MTVPKPNAELAYRVLSHIDEHPEQHDQRDFVLHHHGGALTADAMPCGTKACFAGWTVLLSDYQLNLNRAMPAAEVDGEMVHVDDLAAQLLGIGESGMHDDAPRSLFYDARTREDLGRLVAEIFGPRPEPAP